MWSQPSLCLRHNLGTWMIMIKILVSSSLKCSPLCKVLHSMSKISKMRSCIFLKVRNNLVNIVIAYLLSRRVSGGRSQSTTQWSRSNLLQDLILQPVWISLMTLLLWLIGLWASLPCVEMIKSCLDISYPSIYLKMCAHSLFRSKKRQTRKTRYLNMKQR